jgi:hypothetical protein
MATPAPAHIEGIAKAMLALEGNTPERIEQYAAENWSYWRDTIALATLAFNMSADVCAKEAGGLAQAARRQEALCLREGLATQDEWWNVKKNEWGLAANLCEKASRRIRAYITEE